jgi:hypothetical protein
MITLVDGKGLVREETSGNVFRVIFITRGIAANPGSHVFSLTTRSARHFVLPLALARLATYAL